MSDYSEFLLSAAALAHSVWLVQKAEILERPRNLLKRFRWLANLLECRICIGMWLAIPIWFLPPQITAFLAMCFAGEVFGAAKEKWLKCSECEAKPEVKFKRVD